MDSHILSTKNSSVFVIFMFEFLTDKVVNFEQLAPDSPSQDIMPSRTRINGGYRIHVICNISL